ncbi:hypothetical protein LJC44_02435 [Parabacteroides sp. OttesenSCG-928-G06]|nr:hypothetical protein [Parabacteroides sp. OttesenSCG-928-G06]
MKKLIVAGLLLLFVAACQEKSFQAPPVKTISIDSFSESEIYLSQVTDSIQYVLLDIPEEYISPNGKPDVYFTDNKIILCATYIPDITRTPWTYVYLLFDKKTGHYEGKIGGTTDWQIPIIATDNYIKINHNYKCISDDGRLILTEMTRKESKKEYTYHAAVWDMQTKDLSFTVERGRALYYTFFDNNKVLLYTHNEGATEEKIAIYNQQGEKLASFLYQEHYKPVKEVHQWRAPIQFLTINDTFCYMDLNDNVLYAIDKQYHHYPLFVFDLGDKQPPYYYYAKTTEKERDKDREQDKYYTIPRLTGNSKKLFFQYKCNIVYDAVYDIQTEETAVIKRPFTTERSYSQRGITNDIDGALPFWPDAVHKEELLAYYPSDSIRTYLVEKDAELKKESLSYLQLRDLLDENSGNKPVVAIIQTK